MEFFLSSISSYISQLHQSTLIHITCFISLILVDRLVSAEETEEGVCILPNEQYIKQSIVMPSLFNWGEHSVSWTNSKHRDWGQYGWVRFPVFWDPCMRVLDFQSEVGDSFWHINFFVFSDYPSAGWRPQIRKNVMQMGQLMHLEMM